MREPRSNVTTSEAVSAAPAGVPASSKIAQPDKTVQNGQNGQRSTESPLSAATLGSAAAVPSAPKALDTEVVEGVPFQAATYDADTLKTYADLVSQLPALFKHLDAVEKAVNLNMAARQKLLKVHSKNIDSIHAGCKTIAAFVANNVGMAQVLPLAPSVEPQKTPVLCSDVADMCVRTAAVHIKMISATDLHYVSSISGAEFLEMAHGLCYLSGSTSTFEKVMFDMHALLLKAPLEVKRLPKFTSEAAQFVELTKKHPRSATVSRMVSVAEGGLECWSPPSKRYSDEFKRMCSTPGSAADYDRAALHLMGHKFYCSFRPVSENFKIGFAMNVGIQKALEADDSCVKAGLPLIFRQFGEIAFGNDNLEDVFSFFFKTIPAALKELPWNDHKFSREQLVVSDFRSAPPSSEIGSFCVSTLVIPQTGHFASFDKFGCQLHEAASVPVSREPCPEALKSLTHLFRREVQRERPAINIGLVYR